MPDPAPQVKVINPEGDPVYIPQEDLKDALENKDYQLPPNPNDTIGQQIGAGAEGLASAIPGAPLLEAGLLGKAGSIAAQNERRRTFPITRGATGLVGGVGQALALGAATGGLGELLPGAEAAADVAKGGDALAAVTKAGATPGAIQGAVDAATALGPQSSEAASALGAAMPYAQQAVAGAGFGGTNYTNEAELGDHNFNGEGLAQAMGVNALLGAAGEGAVNILGKTVVPPILDKAGEVLDTAGNSLKNAFVKTSEFVNPTARGKIGPAFDALLSGAKEVPDSAFEQMGDDMGKLVNTMDDASRANFADIHPTEAKELLKETPVSQVLGAEAGTDGPQGILKVRAGIDQEMGRIQQLYDDGSYTIKKPFNDVKRALNQFDAELAKPEATAASVREATVEMRRAVDAAGVNAVRDDSGVLADLKQSVRDPLKDALNDPQIWGAPMAGRNAAINEKFTAMLNDGKNAFGDLGKKEWNENSQKGWVPDPAKIRNLFTGDPLAKQLKLQHFSDYLDSAKAYLDEIKTSAGNAGKVVPGGSDLDSLLKTLTAQRQAASAYAPVSALERSLPRGGEGVGGLGVLGYGAHAVGLSVPGAGAVTAAYGAAKNPLQAMRVFAKIAGAAETTKNVIASGVKKVFASEPLREATAATVRGLTMRSANGASPGSDFTKQAQHITDLANDQARQLKGLSDSTSDLTAAAPNTSLVAQASAVRVLQILAQNLPKNPAPSMLQSENKAYKPGAGELQSWDDLHQALLDPPSFLARVANGTADPRVWQALQQAWPEWTTRVQKATVDHITSHPKLEMDPTQAMAASMILGAPVSPTVSPEQVSFQQQYYQSLAASPATKPRAKGLDKLDLGARSAPGHTRSK